LQKAMEETSGMKLDWFFQQWIYGAGYPKLTVKQIYNPKAKTLKLTVTQSQNTDNQTASAFILPMEVEFTAPSGTKKEKIEIRKRVENFTFNLKEKPTKVVLDKDEKIPLKMVKYE
jgi:aminopeptidase N